MTRLFPFPFTSASILILWLLLNQSLSLGHVLLGTAIAIASGWVLGLLESPKERPKKLLSALRLMGLVFADVIHSNIAVARLIVTGGRRDRKSGFVDIPLELRSSYGLAILACIITATPGTLWVDFDPASGTLTIHVLDLIDENEWVSTVKNRYERLLQEILA